MHHHGRLWRIARAGGLLLVGALLAAPAQALGAAQEGGGLIHLDRSLVVQALNFLILLVLLHRLLYRPLLAKMEERSAAIRKALDEAAAARAEAARQAEEHAARLRHAQAEALAIREAALREAQEEARRQLEAAQARAQRLVEETRAQLDAEIRRAREELRREVADLATAVAEKLLRRSLRDEDHRRIIADAVARIGS